MSFLKYNIQIKNVKKLKMKLPIICAQCMNEDIENAMIVGKVEFNDDSRYEIQCEKGHTSIIVLQQHRFEVLFDIGAYAINDGYYREAISSFSSALERFYEYYIKVICYSKKISSSIISETWDSISSQSERQLGAFILIHLLETESKPLLLSNSLIKFRNAVIHKGKIPNKKEAIKYGQAILDLIRPIRKNLIKDYPEAIQNFTHMHLINSRKSSDHQLAIATLSISTILNNSNEEINLEDALLNLKYW